MASFEDLPSTRKLAVKPKLRVTKLAFREAVRRSLGLLRHVCRFLRDLNDERRVRQHYRRGVRLISFDEVSEEGLSDRWRTTTEPSPRLTIVVATYHQNLSVGFFAQSLVCQTRQNFKVLVIHDGPS